MLLPPSQVPPLSQVLPLSHVLPLSQVLSLAAGAVQALQEVLDNVQPPQEGDSASCHSLGDIMPHIRLVHGSLQVGSSCANTCADCFLVQQCESWEQVLVLCVHLFGSTGTHGIDRLHTFI